jgi:hypothetical protein
MLHLGHLLSEVAELGSLSVDLSLLLLHLV